MRMGGTDSIFRYLGAAIGTTMSIPHSAGAVGAGACSDRAGSIDDLFCGLLRVVSGRLPPRATRRLSAHAAALRSTTVGS